MSDDLFLITEATVTEGKTYLPPLWTWAPSPCKLCRSPLPPYPHRDDKGPGCTRRACPPARRQSPRPPLKTNIYAEALFVTLHVKLCHFFRRGWPPGCLPGSGSDTSPGLAGSPRGQRNPDERLESMVLPWGSWGTPTALGSAVLTMGKNAASTAICLFIPVDNKEVLGSKITLIMNTGMFFKLLVYKCNRMYNERQFELKLLSTNMMAE